MFNINDGKAYLESMYFTNISYIGKKFDGEIDFHLFEAVDEDNQLKKVCFEIESPTKIIVSVQDPESKIYNILSVLKED